MRGLRIVLLLLVALLAWLQWRLWFGNEGLKQRNDALAAEVRDLKSGEAAVEERARSELGMIKPGETFYRVVDQRPAPPADANSADTETKQ